MTSQGLCCSYKLHIAKTEHLSRVRNLWWQMEMFIWTRSTAPNSILFASEWIY